MGDKVQVLIRFKEKLLYEKTVEMTIEEFGELDRAYKNSDSAVRTVAKMFQRDPSVISDQEQSIVKLHIAYPPPKK